jgi:hypothetical protein
MGESSPTKRNGDCEEIANPSTAFGPGGGATGLMPTVPSLTVKLSMPHAATNTASRCNTVTSVHELSSRASTPRLPSAFTGSKSVSTSTFRASARTSGVATDSAPDCMRLRG